ncbi:hypothetical protein CGGC5_v017296 [Colletotrichum fructicola Nara gc5]|uniref:Uncharacterized protein n=1 Tax=Colletotrichum fructicola (strain Nara gc5) TaxID=1213859 RepID=A0A7J6IBU9_COLFN|nr:hypothetical protein CFRS1_v000770 [Colletotrichum fructicola]KAF4473694.1 hypothetical protein CGGC5_v017296 [Colletotrichum fructicola Nara gc5]
MRLRISSSVGLSSLAFNTRFIVETLRSAWEFRPALPSAARPEAKPMCSATALRRPLVTGPLPEGVPEDIEVNSSGCWRECASYTRDMSVGFPVR